MYYLTEDVGDYAVDAPPAGFEVEEENVLIVQQRDEELKTIEEGMVALEQAFNDLQTLSAVNVAVRECIAQGHVTAGVHHRAVAVNRELAKRYKGLSLAAESINHGQSVLVMLKAEEEDQRGFFVKIWDAICKAFQWVWDKIAGLFSSGPEKTEEKAEEAKESAEKLKETQKEEIDLDKLKPALLAISTLCRQGNDKLTLGKLQDWVRMIESNLKVLAGLMGGLNTSYQNWTEFVKKLAPEMRKEDYATSYEQITEKISVAVKHLPAASNETALRRDPSFDTNVPKYKSFVMDHLAKDQALVIREITLPASELLGKEPLVFSGLITPANTTPPTQILDEAPVGDHALVLSDSALRLAKDYAHSAELFSNVARKESARTEEIRKAGEKRLQSATWDTGSAHLANQTIVAQGREISMLLGLCGGTAKNIQTCIDGLSAFVTATKRAIKKDNTEGN